jgi:hypothetical protein
VNSRPAALTYASREDFKAALDTTDNARADSQIDRALAAATDDIEGLCHRVFFPELRTMTFDHPNWFAPYTTPWILRLDANELISVSEVLSAGVDITADVFLRPDDGPPFTRIEVDLSESGRFDSGDTHQRSLSVTGLYGFRDDETAVAELSSNINSSVTVADVDNGALVGVGNLLRINDERVVVTDKAFIDSGENLDADAGAAGTASITVSDGSVFNVDEVLLVNAEKMLITDIAANVLVVLRAWDGSTLQSHTSGVSVSVLRRLSVQRGAVGTTAASHTSGDTVNKHQVPPAVKDLCINEAMLRVFGQRSGFARKAGLDGAAVDRSREAVYRRFGRKYRTRAV